MALVITETTFNLAGGGDFFYQNLPQKILLLIFGRKNPPPPAKLNVVLVICKVYIWFDKIFCQKYDRLCEKTKKN